MQYCVKTNHRILTVLAGCMADVPDALDLGEDEFIVSMDLAGVSDNDIEDYLNDDVVDPEMANREEGRKPRFATLSPEERFEQTSGWESSDGFSALMYYSGLRGDPADFVQEPA